MPHIWHFQSFLWFWKLMFTHIVTCTKGPRHLKNMCKTSVCCRTCTGKQQTGNGRIKSNSDSGVPEWCAQGSIRSVRITRINGWNRQIRNGVTSNISRFRHWKAEQEKESWQEGKEIKTPEILRWSERRASGRRGTGQVHLQGERHTPSGSGMVSQRKEDPAVRHVHHDNRRRRTQSSDQEGFSWLCGNLHREGESVWHSGRTGGHLAILDRAS